MPIEGTVPILCQSFAVSDRGELAASVGVGNQAFELGAAGPAGHLEGVKDHVGAHVAGDSPAHDHAGKRIDDEADVGHTLPRRHMRQIGHPQGVGTGWR